jgi:hypothetical protein
MSEGNVEIVRQAWEAYRCRDNEGAGTMSCQGNDCHADTGRGPLPVRRALCRRGLHPAQEAQMRKLVEDYAPEVGLSGACRRCVAAGGRHRTAPRPVEIRSASGRVGRCTRPRACRGPGRPYPRP